MSSVSTAQHSESPATTHSPSPAPSSSSVPHKPKPINVFSNDGSFLDRLYRTKREEEEKKKQEEMLLRKRNFDERFKRRGKRPAPTTETETTTSEEPVAKKPKSEVEKPPTKYEQDVKLYTEHKSLKDVGAGVRPLIK
ncbi:hypothetical protein SISSUDRAFT_1123591 [Sistotremastrum suecicum HHB10207 ss-3]|uniref:Uncharacterized protein n=1 Tax=Sistotremastrum suecicum HHB10207 ss-3 TaxID=1314776 RepID=A0A165XDG0_9AGAM|nr:hypothetical protein SISSUDRAFT_1123591 [Sistotremastrum suecicum HHB10207 ss-3]